MKNIIITGFMGTGKSSVGRHLSRELKMKFVDTDDLIEKEAGVRIDQIFWTKATMLPFFTPTRLACSISLKLPQILDVPFIVSLYFVNRIAAEFFYKGIGNFKCNYSLTND